MDALHHTQIDRCFLMLGRRGSDENRLAHPWCGKIAIRKSSRITPWRCVCRCSNCSVARVVVLQPRSCRSSITRCWQHCRAFARGELEEAICIRCVVSGSWKMSAQPEPISLDAAKFDFTCTDGRRVILDQTNLAC